jgi:hypothetical protein
VSFSYSSTLLKELPLTPSTKDEELLKLLRPIHIAIFTLAAQLEKLQFQDEGINVGSPGIELTLNFVGAGVTVTRVGNVITITIP